MVFQGDRLSVRTHTVSVSRVPPSMVDLMKGGLSRISCWPWSCLCRVYVAQVSFLAGLSLTSGSFAAAMQNAVPVFAFMIAVMCRYDDAQLGCLHQTVSKLAGILVKQTAQLVCLFSLVVHLAVPSPC